MAAAERSAAPDPRPEPAIVLPDGTDLGRAGLGELLARATGRGYVLVSEIHDVHDPLTDGDGWPDAVARAVRDGGVEVVDDLGDHAGSDGPVELPATTDSVRQYLNSIGRVALLTPEEEVDLAKRFQAGLAAAARLTAALDLPAARRAQLRRLVVTGEAAQERLVTANLRLVVSVARRYAGRGLSLLELIQEGNLGLMRGVEKFDHTKGYKFSTYATWWIKQALTRGTANKARAVRLPVHVHELVARIRRTEFELLQVLGRDPTDEELADALGLSVDRLRELRLVGREVTSLDRTVGEEGETTLGDLVPDDDAIDPSLQATEGEARTVLAAVLATLHERERGVIELRYGLTGQDPLTLEEIGALYGVTRERIRQIEKRTLAKLRLPEHAPGLHDLVQG